MTANEITRRIGAQAIKDWDQKCIVPPDWNADPDQIIRNWLDFGEQVRAHDDNETVLVVTSNGIARFAPHLAGDFDGFSRDRALKLSTGALAIFEYKSGWAIKDWNLKPLL